MWLSLNMLSKMVDTNGISAEDLASRLTMCTAEIESIEYMNKHFHDIIAAKALKVQPHPNADKLTLVDLDTGTETVRVVCGAKNHKEGDILVLAPVGTVLGEDFKIQKTKIRGELSCGMLCSEKELGLSDDHSGIMILPADIAPGTHLSEIYPDYMDIRLEIDNKSITHRPDLWSHYGFAREIGALFKRKVKNPVDDSLKSECKGEYKLEVAISDPEAAPRYTGLAVKNIKIAESPDWLKAQVSSIGMRPINNIVDITNYVMAELGQPMHAFDAKKLKGNSINVRLAEPGECITTLDGKNHELTSEDILITDKGGPIAIAGVMGGGNSEIEDGTSEIVLESANFNPVNIRRTAQRLGARTDAAMRFEKSLSPENTTAALLRCYELIKMIIPDAEATSPIIDAYPVPQKKLQVSITTDYIKTHLGIDITDERIKEILTSLDFSLQDENGSLTIDIPHYRATKDISIAADIVEEIGRIHGYDNIPPVPPLVPCATPEQNDHRSFERIIKEHLSGSGHMFEVSNYSFVGETTLNILGLNEDLELRLRNPLSKEQDRLRRSLVPNLLLNVQTNQRHHDEFALFEVGRVYLKKNRTDSNLPDEVSRVAGLIFQKKPECPLFYEAKRIVMDLVRHLRIRDLDTAPAKKDIPPYAHPGRTLALILNKATIGFITEFHPSVIQAADIRGSVALFDIDLDALFKAQKSQIEFIELQKFPEVPFELSVISDKFDYASNIIKIIQKSSELVRDIEVISVYEGDPIPPDKKSISFRLVFANPKRTLETDEIEKLQRKVISDLKAKGYNLR